MRDDVEIVVNAIGHTFLVVEERACIFDGSRELFHALMQLVRVHLVLEEREAGLFLAA